MEVESFEDEEVAKLLNDWFVSIKVCTDVVCLLNILNTSKCFRNLSVCCHNPSMPQVDREERPDVDKVMELHFNTIPFGVL